MHFILMMAALILPSLSRADSPEKPCLRNDGSCSQVVELRDHVRIPLTATHTLKKPNSDIRRAVIAIHDSSRSMALPFGALIEAMESEGLEQETLLLVPQFQVVTAANPNAPQPDELYWSDEGWRSGNLSVSPTDGGRPRISSFAIIDLLLSALADKNIYPQLRSIVVVGVSAGGQFVQRFAAGSPFQDFVSDLQLKYIVMAPSSYMYLNNQRAVLTPEFHFEPLKIPCLYHSYRYGLDNVNNYMAWSFASLKTRYQSRNVIYVVGELDNRDDGNMDITCGAMAQGAHRLERARHFLAFMDTFFKPHTHRLITVPGVGHGTRLIYTSDLVIPELFPAL